METFSLLLVLFGIGGAGVFRSALKTSDIADRKRQWIKFLVYFLIVFWQLFLVKTRSYELFGILVAAIGFGEVLLIAKNWKIRITAMVIYVLLALGFLTFFRSGNAILAEFLFVNVIVFDGFSQIAGQLFGRTKLFPEISPNKTLEGLAGGLISVNIASGLLAHILDLPMIDAFVSGNLVAVLALSGDLLASAYKRRNGVKDFSRILPGHGGILDRFDSLIFASAGFFVLAIFPEWSAEFRACVVYTIAFVLIFFLAETGFRSLRLKVEITRKFVHFTSGLIVLSFPFFLSGWKSVLVLCLGFTGILVVSKRSGWLPSVNAIERESVGSFVFPISVFTCFLLFHQTGVYRDFYLPIAVLAICDPIAALCGKRWPIGKFRVGRDFKTMVGTMAFFVSCLALSVGSRLIGNESFSGRLITECVALSVVASVTEAFSRKGFDNLLIPFSVALIMGLWNCVFG